MVVPNASQSHYHTESDQNSFSIMDQAHYPLPTGFTTEERQVLNECARESFYYRCVPYSSLMSGLAYFGMKNGYLTKSVKYGYTPKIIYGIIIGYFAGKFSYRNECKEKMLRLPNSKIADYLRHRGAGSDIHIRSSMEDSGSQLGASSSLHADTELSLHLDSKIPDLSERSDGADSYQKVTESLQPYSVPELGLAEPKSYTTYEQLRQENRRKSEIPSQSSSRFPTTYSEQQPAGSSYRNPADSSHRDFDSRSSNVKTGSKEPYINTKKNKYGDVWE